MPFRLSDLRLDRNLPDIKGGPSGRLFLFDCLQCTAVWLQNSILTASGGAFETTAALVEVNIYFNAS
jgi:hypothetical protein